MAGKISGNAGNSRRGSIGRQASGAVLLAWIAIFMAPPANAAEPAREVGAQGDVAANQLIKRVIDNPNWVTDASIPRIRRIAISRALQEGPRHAGMLKEFILIAEIVAIPRLMLKAGLLNGSLGLKPVRYRGGDRLIELRTVFLLLSN